MDQIKQLLELSPPVLLALGLNFLGLGLKRSPIKNWTIPFLLIAAGAMVYPLIADVSKVSFQCQNPYALNAVFGAVIGGCSIGLNQAFRQILYRFGWRDDEWKDPDPPAADPLTRSMPSGDTKPPA